MSLLDRKSHRFADKTSKIVHFCFVLDNESRLRTKLSVFKAATGTKSALQLVMITTYGVKSNKHSGIVSANVTMDHLFVAGE